MKGSIKTYLSEKQYGFIKGDDGKDYFFHASEFRNKNHIANLCDEALVSFDQQATPKGYKAKNCSLLDSSEVFTYIIPDEFIASKSNGVRGWDIVERGEWIVHGTSRDSPDEARKYVIDNAIRVGANALINLEYYKETGSEPGTGKGTHYFTIHNFRGRVATLAKRNSKGVCRIDDLSNLNKCAEELKQKLAEKTKDSKRKRNIIWLSVIFLLLFGLGIESLLVVIVVVVAGFIFGRSTNYDDWLERA